MELSFDQVKSVASTLFFWSGGVVSWLTKQLSKAGLSLSTGQIQIVMVLIDLILILLAVKFVLKPLLKIVIVVLLVWILMGFFKPV